ncbi:DUF6688 family protein [Aeoliella sp.]|uniref:DUF6688 family protein n=1 Tax=Aeoliella sp. TaxID=2795800 RepID=UPI003CCBE5E9
MDDTTPNKDNPSAAPVEEAKPPGWRKSSYTSLFRVWWFIVWGLVFPVVFLCMAGTWGGFEMYQSGRFGTYCVLVFEWQAMIWLYPLLAFSACGLLYQLLRRPTDKAPAWQLGAVLTGLLLWLELFVAWCGAVEHEMDVAASLFLTIIVAPIAGVLAVQPPIVITMLVKGLELKAKHEIVAVVIGTVIITIASLSVYAGGWLVGAMVATPLAVVTYGRASWELLAPLRKSWRISISALLAVFIWLSVNFAAWRRAILVAIDEYNHLPTEPPETCFVITAAAQGHRWLVGSRDVGQAFRVTRQLQLLKALEVLLHATVPQLHRPLRRLYNRVGPQVARRIRFAWLADVVYLAMKPAEWIAWLVVRVVAGVPRSSVRRVYEQQLRTPPLPERNEHHASDQ